MKKILFASLLAIISITVFCFNDLPKFGPRTNKGFIDNDAIDEASGLASSYRNEGILWTHNDSGGENRIFAIDTNGISRGTYYINGVTNRDWEDIAIGPGPDEEISYLYIGDVGDNQSQYEIKYIYRIIEPTVPLDQSNTFKIVNEAETISFTYPDGKRDAETLMIDPLTKDLFVLGKRDSEARLYRLAYPQNISSVIEAELVAKLTFPFDPEENTPQNYLTSGDISIDGANIIIKSYSNIYYWQRIDGAQISQTLLTEPSTLPYTVEPQGEAICWKNYEDNGYFTVSEENISFGGSTYVVPAVLYYYPREIITSVKTNEIFNQFELEQNYPNPFNPKTTIRYTIPNFHRNLVYSAQIKIYDLLGKEIRTVVNKKQKPGNYIVDFNAENLSSGVYYYSLQIGNYFRTRKMVLLK